MPDSFALRAAAVRSGTWSLVRTWETWLRKHHGVDNLVESMKEWGATQGKGCGVAFAEGFRQHLGHSYPQNNLLGELLGRVQATRPI